MHAGNVEQPWLGAVMRPVAAHMKMMQEALDGLLDGMHVLKEDMYTITSDTNLGGSETGLLMQTESAEATQKLIGTEMGMAHKVSVGGSPYEIHVFVETSSYHNKFLAEGAAQHIEGLIANAENRKQIAQIRRAQASGVVRIIIRRLGRLPRGDDSLLSSACHSKMLLQRQSSDQQRQNGGSS